VNLKLFGKEQHRRKTVLLFVIRDKSKTPLTKLVETLERDLTSIWDSVSKPPAFKDTSLFDLFEVRQAMHGCNFTLFTLAYALHQDNPILLLSTCAGSCHSACSPCCWLLHHCHHGKPLLAPSMPCPPAPPADCVPCQPPRRQLLRWPAGAHVQLAVCHARSH
jgi:hypothetical protein